FLNTNYILSNKYLSMGEGYIPENLEQVNNSYTSGNRLLVREARESFERMAQAAKEDGYTIRAMSAYRSYQYQKELYQRYVDQDGVENADTYSARPGFSEHQTGLVVDVDNAKTVYTKFETTKEFLWMQENASNYGFILRYPKGKENITGYTYESWHYRYVGIDIAKKMKETGLTFDEYYVRYIEKEGI
ncbi:MAG: M15 family metallopeptidase, partial [Bacilli bacterium]|nr:M15 family metallopeptidase [Bacilli bacterium]